MTSLLHISSKSQNVGSTKKWHTWPSQRDPSSTWVQSSVKNIQRGSRPLHVLTLTSGYTTKNVIYIFHFVPPFPSLSAFLLIDHQPGSSFCSPRLLDGVYTRHLLLSTLSSPFFFFSSAFLETAIHHHEEARLTTAAIYSACIATRLFLLLLSALPTFFLIFHVHFMFVSFSTEIGCCKMFYRKIHFILSFFISFDLFLPTHCKCRGL